MKRRSTTAVYVTLTLVATLAYMALGDIGRGVVYQAVGLAAIGALWLGARRRRPPHQLPWYLFTIAILLFVGGDAISWSYDLTSEGPVPFPSVSDVFYQSGYPFLLAGLILIVRERKGGKDAGAVIDAAIITLGFGIVAWVFIMSPQAHAVDLSPAARFFSLAYPMWDVLLVALAARFFFSGTASPSFRLINVSFLCLLAGDAVYGGAASLAGPQAAFMNVMWIASYIALSVGALNTAEPEVSAPDQGPVRLTAVRMGALAAASLAGPTSYIVKVLGEEPVDVAFVVVASSVLFLLALARMGRLVKDVEEKVDILKARDAELEKARLEYVTLVEQTPAMSYIETADGTRTYTYVSPQVESLLGYKPEELVGRPMMWISLVHPEDKQRVIHEDEQAEATESSYSSEMRVIRKDGRVAWVHDQAVLIDDGDGARSWHGVMMDITDRQRVADLETSLRRERDAVERLKTLDDMKNTFLQAVSHELRTPLAAILGLSMTLERRVDALSPDQIVEMAGRVTGKAQRLEALLSDLLDLDRLSRGILTPKYSEVDLAEVVERIVENLELPENTEIRVDTERVRAKVDTSKIERIVENLCHNAAKHTPSGTPIYVRVLAHREGALVTVDDDGPGIPNELKQAIFDPFVQGGSAAAHSQGLGIGLSLVVKFAALHGGRAWVEDRPGGGSSFRVLLPYAPPTSHDESSFVRGATPTPTPEQVEALVNGTP